MLGLSAVGHGRAHEGEKRVGVGGAVDDLEVPDGELVERDPSFTRVEEHSSPQWESSHNSPSLPADRANPQPNHDSRSKEA